MMFRFLVPGAFAALVFSLQPAHGGPLVRGLERFLFWRVETASAAFEESVPTVVHFDFDRAVVDPRARAILDLQADWILAHPGIRFRVMGHTDKVGPNSYNDALGLRRARAVVAYLVARGVEPNRLVAMISEGEDLPIVATEARERRNRRVTTEVIGFSGRAARENVPVSTEDTGPTAPTEVRSASGGEDTPDDPSRVTADPAPPEEPAAAPENPHPSRSRMNSGRGNGDEVTDPGGSVGRNRGGDEED